TRREKQWWLPYRNLAAARVGRNDLDGALEAYDDAMRIAPTEPQLTIEKADVLERRGHPAEAIACYEALNKRKPQLQIIANNLAMLLVSHRTDRASLDRARDLTKDFVSSDVPALLDTNGWVRFQRREYEEALPVLERAAERAPESSVIQQHLAMAR